MRSFVLVMCLALVAVACGDDDATTATTTSSSTTTTTSSTTSTTTSSTTTTTAPPPAEVASLCVIGLAPGEIVAVRAGAGDGFDLIGQLSHDATGVGTTGVTATDDADDEWTEIVYEGAAAWVRSHFLTSGPCNTGESSLWAVVDIVCGSILNVRNGQGDGYDILGTLEPDAVDLAGTGVTALDDMDRTWVQIEYDGGVAWVAGWFLTTDPGPTIDCSIPEFPWLIEANSFGPLEFGDSVGDLEDLTGLEWTLQNSYNTCEWYVNDDMSIGLEFTSGVLSEMWAMSPGVAITPEGVQVGDSKADAGAAYFGRAVLAPGPFVGTNIIIDGVNYGANWTYLFIEDPFDEDLIGTIRISPDGGYIEGGCT